MSPTIDEFDDDDIIIVLSGILVSRIRILTPVEIEYKYKSEAEQIQSESCTICLSNLKSDQPVRRLPCFHIYHIDCIDNWLKINHTCPNCRTSMLKLANN